MPPPTRGPLPLPRTSCRNSGWQTRALEGLRHAGCAVVEDVFPLKDVAPLKERMYDVQRKITAELGADRLAAAKELGVLRLMMKYDPSFLRLIEIPEMLSI